MSISFDQETIEDVFEKSNHKCHYCGKQLSWQNYGRRDARGGWEIDHSLAQNRGGTHHLNNLVPACWMCNVDKSDMSVRHFKRYSEPIKQERNRKKVEKVMAEILSTAALVGVGFIGFKIISQLFNKKTEDNLSPPS